MQWQFQLDRRDDRTTIVRRCFRVAVMIAWMMPLVLGCGINKSRLATEQLVVSDAVDKTVASIDFSPLSARKVFFDTQYLDGVNLGPNGNIKYVVSSLRQQMMAYDCRLQEKAETADYVVEGRVGVLSNDGHEVTYGIPGSAAAASASVLLSSPLTMSALPELSLGRRNHQAGTAKIGVFAYDRITREPIWQSGIKKGSSESRDAWVLGLGPYQSHPQANRQVKKRTNSADGPGTEVVADPLNAYRGAIVFQRAYAPPALASSEPPPAVVPAGHQQPIEPPPLAPPANANPTPKPQEHSP